MNQKFKHFLCSFSGFAVLIVLWQIVYEFKFIDSRLFPSSAQVFSKLLSFFEHQETVVDIYSTLYRTVFGFVLAVALAIPTGIFVGMYQPAYRMFRSTIDFFRSLPATAMFPLFLLFFGIGDGSKIAISAFIAFWVILVNTLYGVQYTSKQRRLVARSLGASAEQVFRGVVLYETLPSIMVGLRTGLSLSLIAVVVSEMFIGSNSGLGQKIYDAYVTYESVDLLAWLVITGMVGFVINKVFVFVDTRLLHWVDK
ncbi:ABC transporter permease [Patescibacteria group bacterium]|nr:MAG: ABC transporter permease [Patescibacteria group bacterium]